MGIFGKHQKNVNDGDKIITDGATDSSDNSVDSVIDIQNELDSGKTPASSSKQHMVQNIAVNIGSLVDDDEDNTGEADTDGSVGTPEELRAKLKVIRGNNSKASTVATDDAKTSDNDDEYEYVELSEITSGIAGKFVYLFQEYGTAIIILGLMVLCIIVFFLINNINSFLFFVAFALLAFLAVVLLRSAWQERKRAKEQWLKAETIYQQCRAKVNLQLDAEEDDEGDSPADDNTDASDVE